MKRSRGLETALPYAAAGLLIAFPFTWVFLNLVSSYWRYWDMGTPAANGLALIVLYAPPMLAAQICAGVAAPFLTTRWTRRPWAIVTIDVAAMAVLVVCGFAVEVWRIADLPAARPGSFGGFLIQYLGEWS